jgi:2-aminoethylphosphonate-pyruvate transaminase
MIDTAVILAAGLGSRLKNVTEDRPKGFIEIGGTSIIEASVEKLFDTGIKKIIIGTGYHAEKYDELSETCPDITCIKNSLYPTTGSMYTLYTMKNNISKDFLLLESDLIYDKSGLVQLMNLPWPDAILASGTTNSDDEVFVETNEEKFLVNMSKDRKKLTGIYAELVGISKISKPTFGKMCKFAERVFYQDQFLDYEYALAGIARDVNIFVLKIDNYLWAEIDNPAQLARAKKVIYPQILKSELHEEH